MPNPNIEIVRESSPRGEFSHDRIWFEGDDVVLRGRVTGLPLSRGDVKGLVIIEVFDANNMLVNTAKISQISTYYLQPIPVRISPDSCRRVFGAA